MVSLRDERDDDDEEEEEVDEQERLHIIRPQIVRRISHVRKVCLDDECTYSVVNTVSTKRKNCSSTLRFGASLYLTCLENSTGSRAFLAQW